MMYTISLCSQADRFTVALILESVYGHRVTSLDDDYVKIIERAMEATSASGPAGGSIADFLPFCKEQIRIGCL